jgi:hypothetical protein
MVRAERGDRGLDQQARECGVPQGAERWPPDPVRDVRLQPEASAHHHGSRNVRMSMQPQDAVVFERGQRVRVQVSGIPEFATIRYALT